MFSGYTSGDAHTGCWALFYQRQPWIPKAHNARSAYRYTAATDNTVQAKTRKRALRPKLNSSDLIFGNSLNGKIYKKDIKLFTVSHLTAVIDYDNFADEVDGHVDQFDDEVSLTESDGVRVCGSSINGDNYSAAITELKPSNSESGQADAHITFGFIQVFAAEAADPTAMWEDDEWEEMTTEDEQWTFVADDQGGRTYKEMLLSRR